MRSFLVVLFNIAFFRCFCSGAISFDNAPWADTLIDHLNTTFQSHSLITKTANSKRIRVVFVAGLEGTGHHAWNAIFEQCIVSGSCEIAVNLTQSLMHYDPSQGTVHGLFGAEDVKLNSVQLFNVYKLMENLAQKDDDRIYLVGLCFVHRSAMLSYPNYNGVHKALDHPDISVLAALAELAGLDLRVLLLQRSAREILTSTANRDIGGSFEPKILVDNAAALYAQMRLVDRAFYHCVQYHNLGNLSPPHKHALAVFIHPALAVPLMNKMLSAVRYSGTNSSFPSAEATKTLANRHTDTDTSTGATTSRARSQERMENKLQRHRNRVAKEAQEKSAAQLAAEASSLRYHEWVLGQRLHLIDELCAQV